MESETGQDPRGVPARPRGNKSAIWEIFEDMRYELKATKGSIDSDIKQAREQKQEMESRLASLCFSKNGERRWRMIQKSLDFWIVLGKCQARSRLYGSQLYKQTDSDKKIYETITKIQVEEDQKGKQRNSCILYPGSMFLKVWAALLLFLLAYTVITVPLSIGFLDYTELRGFAYFDWFIDCIFFIDIFINLRTAVVEERDDSKTIFLDYAKSWMFFDIVAVIPFDIFLDEGTYGIRLIAKLPRFFRVFRIVKVLKVNGNFKKNPYLKKLNEMMNLSPAMKTLLSFMVTMFIIIHISGCIWYFLAKMYDFGPGTWIYELKYTEESKTHLYLLSVYWGIATVTTLGYGDIHPFGVTEKVYTLVWMVIGVAFYSYTVSTLSTIMLGSSSDSAKLQVKFSFLNSIAKDAKIKRELLEQLMESLEDAVEIEKINKINKADFLSDVPAHLRFQVTENIYEGVANKVLIFKGRDPDLISNMIPKMIPMKVKKNEFLYRKGQFSSSIYLIFHGRVVEMDNDINFREYSVGSYFGEVEIFKNCPRKYNVKTLEECQLMEINRDDLLNTLKFYPELKIDMITYAIIKDMKTKQTLHKIKDLRSLIRVDLFWRKEETEFARSVGEKIQGLYYFNKKKYENILKLKHSTKGWFKMDQVTKSTKKKGLALSTNPIVAGLKPLKLTDSKPDALPPAGPITTNSPAPGKQNTNFTAFALSKMDSNAPQAPGTGAGSVTTAKRRMSRDMFSTLMDAPLIIQEADQAQEQGSKSEESDNVKNGHQVDQKAVLEDMTGTLDGIKKEVMGFTGNIQRVHEKVSELDILMKKLVNRIKNGSKGRFPSKSGDKSLTKGGKLQETGPSSPKAVEVTQLKATQHISNHHVEVAHFDGPTQPKINSRVGTEFELKVPENKDKDASNLSESMNLSGEVEQIKKDQSAKNRGEEFQSPRSREEGHPMKFTINPASHLNGEMEKFFESIEAVEDNFDRSERTIKSKLYSIGNIGSGAGHQQSSRPKTEEYLRHSKTAKTDPNLIHFEDSEFNSEKSQELHGPTDRSHALVRRHPLQNLELIHETDEGIERSVSHQIGTNTNSRGHHGDPSGQLQNNLAGAGGGTTTSSTSGAKPGLQSRNLGAQVQPGASFNNFLHGNQQTPTNLSNRNRQGNQQSEKKQPVRKSAGNSRDIGDLLKEFDKEQDNDAPVIYSGGFRPEEQTLHKKSLSANKRRINESQG